jgi:hypothetical protein
MAHLVASNPKKKPLFFHHLKWKNSSSQNIFLIFKNMKKNVDCVYSKWIEFFSFQKFEFGWIFKNLVWTINIEYQFKK